jgi:hypothetical protein
MKTLICLALASSIGAAVCTAEPKDEVLAAAKALGQKANYSWTSTMEMANSNFNMPPTQGKTEKDGFTVLTRESDQASTTVVLKGEKGAMKTDDGWKTADELAQAAQGGGGGGRRGGFGAMLLRSRTPVAEVENLLGKVKEVKAGAEGVYTAELTEAGAKERLTFGGRGRGGANPPETKNAKATVKFVIKDGLLTQYTLNVQGTRTFNGEDRDMDITTKVEIKDVGTTKVAAPDEAKKKLSS